jgi:hypothetical protein
MTDSASERPAQPEPSAPAPTGQDVARKAPVQLGLPVRDLDQAFRLSQALALSSIVPKGLRGQPGDILVVLLYGTELGLSAWQSMNGIHVIEGRPAMSAELRVAKTQQAGHQVGIVCGVQVGANGARCGEFGNHAIHGVPTDRDPGRHPFEADWSDERCTVKAVRGDTGMVSSVTWTVEDAVKANLLTRMSDGTLQARSQYGKPLNWELWTRDMLYARASARACKFIAPEVGYGLYTEEEAEQIARAERELPRCQHCRSTDHASSDCPEVQDAVLIDPADARAEAARIAEEYAGGVGRG